MTHYDCDCDPPPAWTVVLLALAGLCLLPLLLLLHFGEEDRP